MAKNKFFLVVVLLLVGHSIFATNRFVIFLTDKAQSDYSISQPEAFLSAKALERRNNQNIDITSEDLPVSQYYLDSLETKVNVLFASKWKNAVLVETDSTVLNEISIWSFVKEYAYVAPGESNGNGRLHIGTQSTRETEITQINNYTQNHMLGAMDMHEQGYRGEDMLIAVFDSGFENVDTSPYFSHLTVNNQIIGTRDFVRKNEDVFQYDTHGTKVLSCMAAFKEGEYTGMSYEADYVLCVTEDVRSEYRIEEYNWLMAAEYADSIGVDVINSSVGYSYFDDNSMNYSYQDMDGETAVITQAATIASSKGMIVVSSVGNEGNNNWYYMNAPADARNILSIGSVDENREKSYFSSFGPTADERIKPELVAMGSSTITIKDQVLQTANGTSFSSPLVAGLVACFWQSQRDLTNLEIMEKLKSTATNAENPNDSIGYGIPNFLLASGQNVTGSDDYMSQKFTVYPNPVTGKKVYLAPVSIFVNRKIQFQLFDLKGNLYKRTMIEAAPHQDLLELDLSDIKSGHYILQCYDNVTVKEVKLIVL